MEQVLIVEDCEHTARMSSVAVTAKGYLPIVVSSLAEARELLSLTNSKFLAAILDLNLPDAPNGEVVDEVMAHGIPTIVLTSDIDEARRAELLKRQVLDYMIKGGAYTYDYIGRLLTRLDRNRHYKALVVDDTALMRKVLSAMLMHHNFQVLEANDGRHALQVIAANPDIRLLITDYNMPEMDGFALINEVRREFDREAMAIIGLSAQGSPELSAKFIKHGANDFLTKPFSNEEFYCRIMQNIEGIEQFDRIRDSANRDYLTQLYNRRYFFEVGGRQYREAVAAGRKVTLAMLDIDHFKKINDTYGHDAGDLVLKRMALMLQEVLPGHLVARFGGEEYCVLMLDVMPAVALAMFHQLRIKVEQSEVVVGDKAIHCTVSIGVNTRAEGPIEQALKLADKRLYRAKETGRNQVLWED